MVDNFIHFGKYISPSKKKHIPMESLIADSGGIHLSPFLKTSQDIELYLVIGAVTSFNMV